MLPAAPCPCSVVSQTQAAGLQRRPRDAFARIVAMLLVAGGAKVISSNFVLSSMERTGGRLWERFASGLEKTMCSYLEHTETHFPAERM